MAGKKTPWQKRKVFFLEKTCLELESPFTVSQINNKLQFVNYREKNYNSNPVD